MAQQQIVDDEAIELMPMHGNVLLPAVVPRVFLENLHAHQVRHHIGEAEIVIPFHPNHFHTAFRIRKLADIPEKLPVFFLESAEIEVGKDVAEQNQPPEGFTLQHSDRLARMAHIRAKMHVGQDQGIGQDLFLKPSLLISYYRKIKDVRMYEEWNQGN